MELFGWTRKYMSSLRILVKIVLRYIFICMVSEKFLLGELFKVRLQSSSFSGTLMQSQKHTVDYINKLEIFWTGFEIVCLP